MSNHSYSYNKQLYHVHEKINSVLTGCINNHESCPSKPQGKLSFVNDHQSSLSCIISTCFSSTYRPDESNVFLFLSSFGGNKGLGLTGTNLPSQEEPDRIVPLNLASNCLGGLCIGTYRHCNSLAGTQPSKLTLPDAHLNGLI